VRERGVTAHGLRHEVLIGHYEALAGTPPPVRGGQMVPPELDRQARQSVSRLAGHARIRASGAYLGAVRVQRHPGSRDVDGMGDAPPERAS